MKDRFSTPPEKPWALILAAGQGNRLASAKNGLRKQFLIWRGVPLYWHSARAMSRSAAVAGLVFIFPATLRANEEAQLHTLHRQENLGLPYIVADGGVLRQDSVRLGLHALPKTVRLALIHDAARPFLRPALIQKVCTALHEGAPAVVPALPVTDTVKQFEADRVIATLPRENLVYVQTPQGFRVDLLRKAHEQAVNLALTVTDDAALMENEGHTVFTVPGDVKNCKITRPDDLALLVDPQTPPCPCTGMGYDVHRYKRQEGQNTHPLKLGGVTIPGPFEVIAHSDGDVLLHALMDALLGCAGLDDIGKHFPDSDNRLEGISSAVLLDHVLELLRTANVFPQHVDMTVVAQKPHLHPYRAEIRKNIARLMSLPVEHVNLKATTEEGMCFTGRCEGIKAYAIVSALRHPAATTITH